jgi:hypothetical protein
VSVSRKTRNMRPSADTGEDVNIYGRQLSRRRRALSLRTTHATQNRATLARNATREEYTGRKSRFGPEGVHNPRCGTGAGKSAVFEMERPRCNVCCQVFTAKETALIGAGKYDTTAVAMIALLTYGAGVPFNRMERLGDFPAAGCRRYAFGGSPHCLFFVALRNRARRRGGLRGVRRNTARNVAGTG